MLNYHAELEEALGVSVKLSLIKAAGVFKEATALFASTTTLTEETFDAAFDAAFDAEKTTS